ncbi:MAG TPA: hypothetical protein DEA22_01550 [Blastocatellia bacterium]|nr:hypothetical protein [Blastocatellia bacterium]
MKKTISPDIETAREVLNELWSAVLAEGDLVTDDKIDRLIENNSVSIRFCLPTQLLGKLTDHNLDSLCLQKGHGATRSQWDPRSFAAKVLVPWVMENQNVLGTSTDPYVSKPLRKPRLESDPAT